MVNEPRDTNELRRAPGDKWAKLHSEIGKVAYHPATPGILVVGGTGQSAPIAGTPVATGLSQCIGVATSVCSPVTPTMTAEITATPLLNGNFFVSASPAITINWIAIGL